MREQTRSPELRDQDLAGRHSDTAIQTCLTMKVLSRHGAQAE
ncbi:MAG: hypothetical protein AB7E21_13495 [Pseudodonghicola sp.]